MRFIILFCMLMVMALSAKFLHLLIKKRWQSKSGITIVITNTILVIVILWYFTPFYHRLPQPEDMSINLIYTAQGLNIDLKEKEKPEFKAIIESMPVQREFFNGYRGRNFHNENYVYIIVLDGAGGQIFGMHVMLGSATTSGFCCDNEYNKITYNMELEKYLREIFARNYD